MQPLSPREREVLTLRSQGLHHKEVAYEMGITEQTVKNHITSIYKKLGVQNLVMALRIAGKVN